MPWLLELSKDKKVQTVTPGEIRKTNGRSEQLIIKVSTTIQGGFKLLARKGNSVQEVFVVTSAGKEELSLSIKQSRPYGKRDKE